MNSIVTKAQKIQILTELQDKYQTRMDEILKGKDITHSEYAIVGSICGLLRILKRERDQLDEVKA